MKNTFINKHLETIKQVTDLPNLLDELRGKPRKRHRLNILLSSK